MMRHDELLEEIERNELALDSIVAKRRKDFTRDFFDHLHTKCDANYKNLVRRDGTNYGFPQIFLGIESKHGESVRAVRSGIVVRDRKWYAALLLLLQMSILQHTLSPLILPLYCNRLLLLGMLLCTLYQK